MNRRLATAWEAADATLLWLAMEPAGRLHRWLRGERGGARSALAGWLAAALNPGALVASAAAQRHVVVAAWAAATAGPDATAESPGDGWRGGPGIPRFGAGK